MVFYNVRVTQHKHHATFTDNPPSNPLYLAEAYLTSETDTDSATFTWRTSEPIEPNEQDDEAREITVGVLKGNHSLLIRTKAGTITQFSQWVKNHNSYLEANAAEISRDTITVPVPAELHEALTSGKWTADLSIDGKKINSVFYPR